MTELTPMMHEEPMVVERLPALIDRARHKLAEARTSAEFLEAKKAAGAALHYAKVTSAANEVHVDCIRIITRAEIRIAREVDAAQERGEVSRGGRPAETVQTSDSLGLDRRRVAEWRELAGAGEEAVDEAIDEAAAEAKLSGRTVTKEAVKKKVATRRTRPPHVPVAPPKPPHLIQFALWLQTGCRVMREFADHREMLSLANRFGVTIDPDEVRDMMEFLSALNADLNADRAA